MRTDCSRPKDRYPLHRWRSWCTSHRFAVPFTSEAKEAIASYPEILKELKLGLQQCGRELAGYLRQEQRRKGEYAKRAKIDKYLPHVGLALPGDPWIE